MSRRQLYNPITAHIPFSFFPRFQYLKTMETSWMNFASSPVGTTARVWTSIVASRRLESCFRASQWTSADAATASRFALPIRRRLYHLPFAITTTTSSPPTRPLCIWSFSLRWESWLSASSSSPSSRFSLDGTNKDGTKSLY